MFDFVTNPDFTKAAVLWIGALCTVGIYSILYKENKVFRFFEHLFIGLATGYTIYTAWNDVLRPHWWEPLTHGQWWWIFALPGGLLFYMIYSRRHAWMSRLIFGLFFGATAGRAFQAYAAYYFPLASSVVRTTFINPPKGHGPGTYAFSPVSATLNNLLFLVIVVSVMTYFFFSFEQKNAAIRGTSKLGRFILMFAFGAIFGSTIMARMSLLIGRLYFLIHDWIQVGVLHRGP